MGILKFYQKIVATGGIQGDIIGDAGSIGTAELADLAVTAAKLGALAVETAKIDALAVTPSELATDAVETLKIKDLNVTTAKLAAQATTHPKLDEQVEQFVDVTLSTAEILALNATPIEVVAAPGSTKVLVFTGALVFYDFNANAYGGIAAGENLAIRYTDASGLIVGELETVGFLDLTADAQRWINPIRASSGVSSIVSVANAKLVANILVGEIITGDSPLLLRVFYRVLPSTLA